MKNSINLKLFKLGFSPLLVGWVFLFKKLYQNKQALLNTRRYNHGKINNFFPTIFNKIAVNLSILIFLLTFNQLSESVITIRNITSSITGDILKGTANLPVSMTVDSTETSDLQITNVKLTFWVAGQEKTSYYDVTPSPSNPTIVRANSTGTVFNFTVKTDTGTPVGQTEINGTIAGFKTGSNVVLNPGFEQGSGIPATSWYHWNNNSAVASYGYDFSSKTEGARSYRLTFTNATNNPIDIMEANTGEPWDYLIPSSPNTTYSINVWYRIAINSGNADAAAVIREYDSGRNIVRDTAEYRPLEYSNVWIKKSFTYTTGGNVSYIKLMLRFQAVSPGTSASVWFDDIVVRSDTTISDSDATTKATWKIVNETTPPPAPNIFSPLGGTKITSFPITFDWSDVSDSGTGGSNPCTYELQISVNSWFDPVFYNNDKIGTASTFPISQIADGSYYWRVRTKDAVANFSQWMAITTPFEIDTKDRTPPPVPTLISPASGAQSTDSTPDFRWSTVTDNQSNPVTYTFQLDDDTSFSTPEINTTGLSSNGYTPSSPLATGKNYYWHLRAVDTQGNQSAWSQTWSIIIYADSTPPGKINNLSVPTGQNVGYNHGAIKISWTSPGDDGSTNPIENGAYKIQVSSYSIPFLLTNAQFEIPVELVNPGSTQSYIIKNLIPGTTYSIAMWIRDDANNWSEKSNEVSGTAYIDTIPPGKINDLSVQKGTTEYSYVLEWTVPGDESTVGNLTGWYKIQYSSETSNMNIREFAQVTVSTLNAVVGTKQRYRVYNLTEDKYYFMMWVADEVPFWSSVSNLATTDTSFQPESIPPGTINDLSTEYIFNRKVIKFTWTVPGNNNTTGAYKTANYRLQFSTTTETKWGLHKAHAVFVHPNISAGSMDSYEIPALAGGSTYYFHLWIADESANWSTESNLATIFVPLGVEDRTPPDGITDLQVQGHATKSDTIILTWTTPGDDGSIGNLTSRSRYQIQFSSTDFNVVWSSANAQVTVSTFSVNSGVIINYPITGGFTAGVTYYFRIWTTDENSNISLPSNISNTSTIDVTAPAKITGISYTKTNQSGTLVLSIPFTGDNTYQDILNSGEIRVQYSSTPEINWSTATAQVVISTGNVLPQDILFITVTGLDTEKEFYFRVWVADERGNWSPDSDILNLYLPAPEKIPPSAVNNLEVINITCDQAILSWTVTGDDGTQGNIYNGKYYLKFSTTAMIMASTWDQTENYLILPASATPGTIEYRTIFLTTPGATYYFALKLADEQDNWSEISNSVFAYATNCDLSPPALIVKYHPPDKVNLTGNKVVVIAEIRDNVNLVKVEMKYRLDSNVFWFTANISTVTDNNKTYFKFEIPATDINNVKKVDYYISTFDGMNFTYFGTPAAPRKISFDNMMVTTQTFGAIQVPDGNPDDGAVQLDLIRNALDADQLTIEQVNVPAALSGFKFTAKTIPLSYPAKLTLLYFDFDQNGIVDGTDVTETNLQIYRQDEYINNWNLMGGEINPVLNTVSVKINRLGTYAIFNSLQTPTAGSEETTDKLFITPFSPYLNFSYEITEVKIYSIQGKLVTSLSKEGNNRITWDGKAITGTLVESGLYICKTRSQEGKVKYLTIVIAK